MRRHQWTRLCSVVALVAGLAACSSGGSGESTSPNAQNGNAIKIGSFDFAESKLLAELYSQALEGGGFPVQRELDLGPREFVAPALANGLVDFVPEYAGTAAQFLSLGSVQPGADETETYRALVKTLEGTPLRALAPSPAQDANTFVVSRRAADSRGLRSLSDVAKVGPELTFGGPPECSSRPLCLVGLERVYGAHFKEVVSLDVGGPLTRQALQTGVVDMALLFTTDPAVAGADVVELTDDRGLRPAENVTPLVRAEVVDRGGPRLVEVVDAVSAHLTTDGLRAMNSRVAGGGDIGVVASSWLAAEGLR